MENDFSDLLEVEIVQTTTNQKASEEDVSDDEAIQTALEYINQQEEATHPEVVCFQRWRNIAATKVFQAKKQKNITDFLPKINSNEATYNFCTFKILLTYFSFLWVISSFVSKFCSLFFHSKE